MLKKYAILIVFLLQNLILFAQSWEQVKKEKQGKIEIHYFNSAPFIYENSEGKIEGVEADLIYEFVNYLEKTQQIKLEVLFKKANGFADMYEKTKKGKSGTFGISSISITENRKKDLQFSPPYMADIEVLICSQDIPDAQNINELINILQGKTALYVPNSTYEFNLSRLREEYFLNINLEKVRNADEATEEVSARKGVFSFTDLVSYLLSLKEKKKIKRQNFFSATRTGYAIAFPLKSDWNEPINAFFKRLDYQIFIKNTLQKYLGVDVHELMVDMSSSDSLKKNMDIVLLTREKKLQDLELKNKQLKIEEQNIIQKSLIVGVILVCLLIFLFYNRYKIEQKSNHLLVAKNLETQTQSQEIQEKNKHLEEAFNQINKQNKHIYASIQYAKRIQAAMFPMDLKMESVLNEYFVFLEPKAVVSGDFYYFVEKSKIIVLAAADCTGHGVPGALMSMLGTALLNEAVMAKNASSPAYILGRLHKGIRKALKQAISDSRDGMDIAIVVLQKEQETEIEQDTLETKPAKIIKFDYAGAMNSLIYIKNKQLYEIKADKMPIGGREMGKERIYTDHDIPVLSEMVFYLCSDGFRDQIGGADSRKLMAKNFKKILLEIHHLPLKEQKKRLVEIFEDWKGENRQIDDVLVMGVKIA